MDEGAIKSDAGVCKAYLAMACAGKASLALQAYFQTPPDSCASLLIATSEVKLEVDATTGKISEDKQTEIFLNRQGKGIGVFNLSML